MTNLRDLVYGYGQTIKKPRELAIWNTTDRDTPSNGGVCCLFTVPGSTTRLTGQMWGGGGAGQANCCYSHGNPGAAGGYVEFSIEVEPSMEITMCSAGTTARATGSVTAGVDGNDTYMCVEGIWCIEAHGGCRGFACQGKSCIWQQCCGQCGRGNQAGYGCARGITGSHFIHNGNNSLNWAEFCACLNANQIAPSGYGLPPRLGVVFFRTGNAPIDGMWPGGGGFTNAAVSNSCCCGGFGAAGGIYIVYEGL